MFPFQVGVDDCESRCSKEAIYLILCKYFGALVKGNVGLEKNHMTFAIMHITFFLCHVTYFELLLALSDTLGFLKI